MLLLLFPMMLQQQLLLNKVLVLKILNLKWPFKINVLNHKNDHLVQAIDQVSFFFYVSVLMYIFFYLGPQAKKLKGDGSANGNGVKGKGKPSAGSDDDDEEDDDDDDESVS
jgi:hypothetical protein